jgi:tRNA G18 (ribose-2'-O)-methylase SpoU
MFFYRIRFSKGLPRSIAQVVAFDLIPIALNGSKDNSLFYFSTIWNFLNENIEASKMRDRQKRFFVEYDITTRGRLSGLLKLKVDDHISSSDIFPKHLLTVIEEFLSSENSNNSSGENGTAKAGVALDIDTLQSKRIPFDELQLTLLQSYQEIRKRPANFKRQQTIVCASLLSKATNLGGLVRTCEIFAIEKLLLPDLKILKDETFLNLAVSSENWLPVEEVPEKQLVSSLREYRRLGYTIVGLEQTDSSISLEKFEFRSRCVLVLGKEREGLPVEVLQEVDVCVEIPQFGITRSLNVHVSASIAIWEATKQKINSAEN